MPTVLITGANRGIGLSLARLLLERGDSVIATARNPDQAVALRGLAARDLPLDIRTLDVRDAAACDALAGELSGHPIDVVVANAAFLNSYSGIDHPGHDADAWADVLMTNVAGAYFTARAFRSHLAKTRGKLVFISSIMGASARPRGGAYPYRCSKAALNNLAANLALELEADGIAVTALDPGWVKTEMGGTGAEITPDESAAGLARRIDALTLDRTGRFENYLGETLPF
ncbi:MAG: SDR family oxidoreductase [Hyphomicrobiaceae bacterium]